MLRLLYIATIPLSVNLLFFKGVSDSLRLRNFSGQCLPEEGAYARLAVAGPVAHAVRSHRYQYKPVLLCSPDSRRAIVMPC